MPIACLYHRWFQAFAAEVDDLGRETMTPVGPWICQSCLVVRSEVYWGRVLRIFNGLGTKLLFDTAAVLGIIGALRIIGVI